MADITTAQSVIHPTAHIADKASLALPLAPLSTSQDAPSQADPRISIGALTLLHPFSTINAVKSTVSIGPRCVLWEKSTVGAPAPDTDVNASDAETQTRLAEDVTIHAYAIVHAGASIGKASVIGVRAVVGVGASLAGDVMVTSGGVVPAGARIGVGAVVGPNGIIRPGSNDGKPDQVDADLVKLRKMRAAGREKERQLGVKLVKGRAGGGGMLGKA